MRTKQYCLLFYSTLGITLLIKILVIVSGKYGQVITWEINYV